MRKALKILSILFIPTMSIGQTVVLSEDFNNGIPPATWSIVDNDGNTPNSAVSEFTSAWITMEDFDSTGVGDSTAASTSWYDPTGQSEDYLITPSTLLGSYGNWLHWDMMSQDASYPESMMILASTTGTNPADFTDTLAEYVGITPYWTTDSVTLDSSGLTGQSVFIAFVNVSDNKFILHLDNISITVEDPSTITEQTVSNLDIYPNPAQDMINISSSNRGTLYFTSVDGRSVSMLPYDGSGAVSIGHLASGMYVVELRGEGEVLRSRVIIE